MLYKQQKTSRIKLYAEQGDGISRLMGTQGFWKSGENGYLFSGSCGALVNIFRDLGSKLIVFGI